MENQQKLLSLDKSLANSPKAIKLAKNREEIQTQNAIQLRELNF